MGWSGSNDRGEDMGWSGSNDRGENMGWSGSHASILPQGCDREVRGHVQPEMLDIERAFHKHVYG